MSVIVRPRTAADIDSRVERILADLGRPEPPLDLPTVRELLRLDLAFYRLDDPSLLDRTVSRMKIAGKQVLARPTLLLDAVRKLDLKALYIPDQRRIMIDGSQPVLKHRWSEAHEIGHSILPWHDGAMLGDDRQTLLPACHAQLEAEANLAAAKLLFLRDRFDETCRAYAPSIASVKALKPLFGNTYATTFWRAVMVWGEDKHVLGMISDNPAIMRTEVTFNPAQGCKHFITPPAFASAFPTIGPAEVFPSVTRYCKPARGGPLGSNEIVIPDADGNGHAFAFESFSFGHQTLTLGVHSHVVKSQVALRSAGGSL
ncbi:hypothetical protein [Parvularcula oceani]|uniref:hypothetical protein n=1 Tax=Parvularcula oceani TaxID=1247963 RepID=UPI0004E18016|nr:hypothetical protein [Parvularcula oceani]